MSIFSMRTFHLEAALVLVCLPNLLSIRLFWKLLKGDSINLFLEVCFQVNRILQFTISSIYQGCYTQMKSTNKFQGRHKERLNVYNLRTQEIIYCPALVVLFTQPKLNIYSNWSFTWSICLIFKLHVYANRKPVKWKKNHRLTILDIEG